MPKHAILNQRAARGKRSSRKLPERSNGRTGQTSVATKLQSAIKPTIAALRRLATYKMDPALARRMHELGERKEFLGKKEHDELLRLVEFWEQRLIDKLAAKVALKELRRVMPRITQR